MARAYRCPVCGIDFPAGTPGAPRAADSPAEISEPHSEAEAVPPVDGLAALDEDSGPDETLGPPQAASDAPSAEPGGAAGRLHVRPSGAASGARRQNGTHLRATRDRAVVVADPPATAVVKKRRRSKARSLAGTFVLGVFLAATVTGVAWYLGDRVGAPLGGRAPALALSVSAEDGWVSLPREEGGLLIEADGPFRLRVNGDVYTLDGAKPVRVPAEVIAAVRIVRPPTRANVSFAARVLGATR
ncbi:MAG: hypothetical protein AAGF45_07885 [Pseudomonadota bacterium]